MPARPSAGALAGTLAVLAATLTACAEPPARAGPSAPADAPARAGADGRVSAVDPGTGGVVHALVRRVDPGAATVTVDVVELFTGAAAARACAEDGVPAHAGGLCDTYYLRDRSPGPTTLPVRPGAAVRAGSCAGPRPATLGQVAAGLPRHRLFRLELAAGAVTAVTPACPESRPAGG